jgi:hypothetical protein
MDRGQRKKNIYHGVEGGVMLTVGQLGGHGVFYLLRVTPCKLSLKTPW